MSSLLWNGHHPQSKSGWFLLPQIFGVLLQCAHLVWVGMLHMGSTAGWDCWWGFSRGILHSPFRHCGNYPAGTRKPSSQVPAWFFCAPCLYHVVDLETDGDGSEVWEDLLILIFIIINSLQFCGFKEWADSFSNCCLETSLCHLFCFISALCGLQYYIVKKNTFSTGVRFSTIPLEWVWELWPLC